MNKRLEYFRKGIRFTGKHSRYIDALWKQNAIQESFIKTLYELCGVAAIIGLRIQSRKPADNSEGTRNLQLEQIVSYEPVLKTIMITVLLLDESMGRSCEEKIQRAFRGPETEAELEEDLELFNSYVRGGIEFLYSELVERVLTINDEYTDARVGNIMALLENPLLQ